MHCLMASTRFVQLNLGIESAERGELIPHEEVMAEMDALIQDLAEPGANRG